MATSKTTNTIKLYKFDECDACVNREYDPVKCLDCEDACNFEPFDPDEDLETEESLTYREFIDIYRDAA